MLTAPTGIKQTEITLTHTVAKTGRVYHYTFRTHRSPVINAWYRVSNAFNNFLIWSRQNG